MNPAQESSSADDTVFGPLACINAQENSFVQPLREYLEAHGCRVIFDPQSGLPVRYYIVVGGLDFVERILAQPPGVSGKTLGIIVGSSLTDGQALVSHSTKIVVVDPIALSPQDVLEIFSFFFAGNGEVLNKRRTTHVPPVSVVEERKEVMEEQQENEEKEDEKRIGSIITDIFGQTQQTKYPQKGSGHWIRKIFLTLLIFCLPVLWYVTSLSASVLSFGLAAKQLKVSDTTKSERLTRFGNYWLTQATVSFTVLEIPLKISGFTSVVRGQERLLSFLYDIHLALGQSQEVLVLGHEVGNVILSQDATRSETPAVLFEKLQLSLRSLTESLGLAQAQLASLLRDRSFPFFIPVVARAGTDAAQELASHRSTLSYAESLLQLYPRFSGFNEPKTYLVLLQNSAELRPTGGFIGSIGKLTFDGGVLSDFVIQDVYEVDGQLKGHVDPPKPIAELLSQEHWYLRDSNWNPDFSISGAQAAWFYEKETRESVSGVIGLSLPLIEDILRITGPVMLSDYNDQVTADNFLGKSIFYTKSDFFPGSTAKSDFLGKLSRTLLLTLTTDKGMNAPQLFDAVVLGISRRDIQFMFIDEELQQLVEHFGWAGRVMHEPECDGVDKEICLFDPLVVNEANVSVSKVNAFIKHANLREITITQDGHIQESMNVTLTNTAENNEPGVGGPYRTYIRFFVPGDASVASITLDGQVVPSRNRDEQPIPTLPYLESVEAPVGARGIGTAVEVGQGRSSNLRISYTRPASVLAKAGETVFELSQHKQAGVSGTTQVTTINFPPFWQATDESPQQGGFLVKEGQFEYNTTIQRDLLHRLRFTK